MCASKLTYTHKPCSRCLQFHHFALRYSALVLPCVCLSRIHIYERDRSQPTLRVVGMPILRIQYEWKKFLYTFFFFSSRSASFTVYIACAKHCSTHIKWILDTKSTHRMFWSNLNKWSACRPWFQCNRRQFQWTPKTESIVFKWMTNYLGSAIEVFWPWLMPVRVSCVWNSRNQSVECQKTHETMGANWIGSASGIPLLDVLIVPGNNRSTHWHTFFSTSDCCDCTIIILNLLLRLHSLHSLSFIAGILMCATFAQAHQKSGHSEWPKMHIRASRCPCRIPKFHSQ